MVVAIIKQQLILVSNHKLYNQIKKFNLNFKISQCFTHGDMDTWTSNMWRKHSKLESVDA